MSFLQGQTGVGRGYWRSHVAENGHKTIKVPTLFPFTNNFCPHQNATETLQKVRLHWLPCFKISNLSGINSLAHRSYMVFCCKFTYPLVMWNVACMKLSTCAAFVPSVFRKLFRRFGFTLTVSGTVNLLWTLFSKEQIIISNTRATCS